MRNLTIKRTKSFVGCVSTMKIYLEDPTSNEIVINNTPCRKIGDLKNGEEKTFEIGEQAAKVFVIFDKISRNYCNDYYQLSDGQEDIFLSGKNKYNPTVGNAFRFDNNDNEEALANRKHGKRKGLLVFIAALIVGAIIGYSVVSFIFSNQTPEVKTFSSDGLTITLTNAFRKTDIGNYTVVYDSKNVAVFALEEPFESVDGFEDYTLEQYADLLIQVNNVNAETKTVDGLTCFEYEAANPETNDVYQYFSYVYKTNDAFWMVQFATLDKDAESYSQQITEWAKSVEFSN